ncbi:hypothetical protein QYE76_028235 [Lolium multiflorum]|uniref:Reverse transcriptase Ty1/copia-type domain-containing protein n=1 Tax=Lolium multiflorum TaxID=4521 RepID=A0AAD8VEC9_LOLMU|nr:hypothetical protein QYE76_028235 [Lolium multiflorum]
MLSPPPPWPYSSTSPMPWPPGAAIPWMPGATPSAPPPASTYNPALTAPPPSFDQAQLMHAFNTMSLTPPSSNEWFMDSGASAHMTGSEASSEHLLRHTITVLEREFSLKDLGALHYFLGVAVTRSPTGMFLSQRQYILDVLDRAGMTECNPCSTPVDTQSKLGTTGAPVADPSTYRSLVGALQYLSFTRLDVSYAIQHVCLYMHDPREPHLNAVKRILRYLCGTVDYGLQLHRSSPTSLTAYTDAE